MALIQKMEAPSGVELKKGYHKISEGTMKWIESKRRWYLYYTVAHYLDRTARKSGKEPLFYSNYLMKMDLTDEAKGNPIAQAYAHLKTLDEYEEAGDI